MHACDWLVHCRSESFIRDEWDNYISRRNNCYIAIVESKILSMSCGPLRVLRVGSYAFYGGLCEMMAALVTKKKVQLLFVTQLEGCYSHSNVFEFFNRLHSKKIFTGNWRGL